MRPLVVFFALFWLSGCTKISNSINLLSYRCGESAAEKTHWIKVFDPEGDELSGPEKVRAFLVDTRGNRTTLQVSEKSCIPIEKTPETKDQLLIIQQITSKRSLSSISKVSDLSDTVTLSKTQAGLENLDCSWFRFRLGSLVFQPAENISRQPFRYRYNWEVAIKKATFLDAGTADPNVLDNLAGVDDFEQRLSISREDLLEGKQVEESCLLRIDRKAPVASFTLPRIQHDEDVPLLTAGHPLEVRVTDQSNWTLNVCFVSEEAQEEACNLKTVELEGLTVPSSGKWKARYEVIDEAGNTSGIQEFVFLSQETDKIALIKSDFERSLTLDPYSARRMVLAAEDMRQSLKTEREKSTLRSLAQKAMLHVALSLREKNRLSVKTEVFSLVISEELKTVVLLTEDGLDLVNLKNNETSHIELPSSRSYFRLMRLSPDQLKVAVALDKVIHIVDLVDSGIKTNRYENYIETFNFHPDGSELIISFSNETLTMKERAQEIRLPENEVIKDIVPGKKFAIAKAYKKNFLLNLEDNRIVNAYLHGVSEGRFSFEIEANFVDIEEESGVILTATVDGEVKLWPITESTETIEAIETFTFENGIQALKLIGKHLVIASKRELLIFDTTRSETLKEIPVPGIESIQPISSSELLIKSRNQVGKLNLRDKRFTELEAFVGKGIEHFAYSKTSFATIGYDREVSSRKELRIFSSKRDYIARSPLINASWNERDSSIVGCDQNSIKIFDTKSAKVANILSYDCEGDYVLKHSNHTLAILEYPSDDDYFNGISGGITVVGASPTLKAFSLSGKQLFESNGQIEISSYAVFNSATLIGEVDGTLTSYDQKGNVVTAATDLEIGVIEDIRIINDKAFCIGENGIALVKIDSKGQFVFETNIAFSGYPIVFDYDERSDLIALAGSSEVALYRLKDKLQLFAKDINSEPISSVKIFYDNIVVGTDIGEVIHISKDKTDVNLLFDSKVTAMTSINSRPSYGSDAGVLVIDEDIRIDFDSQPLLDMRSFENEHFLFSDRAVLWFSSEYQDLLDYLHR